MIKLLTWVKNIFIFIWLLLLLLVGAWVVTDNQQGASPVLFGFQLPALSLGVYLCAAIFFGVLLGFVTSFLVTQGRLFSKKRELSRTNKELHKLQTAHSQS